MKAFARMALAGLLVAGLAVPAVAGDGGASKRDYDRGFFINLEGWWSAPEDLPNEWATVDDAVQELNYGHELTPRITIGGHFGPKVGTFSLTYWEFNEDKTDSVAGEVYSTLFRNEMGMFSTGFARQSIEARTLDLTWTKGFGCKKCNKFTGFWALGARYWEYEDDVYASFDDGAGWWHGTADDEGMGLRVGVGGTYQVVPKFAIRSSLYASFLQGDADMYFTVASGQVRTEDDNKIFVQLEGDVAFLWNPVAGLEFAFGYRYQEFQDAVDRPGGPGGTADVAFDGPFVGVGVNFGTAMVDTDGDGVLDYLDQCPDTPNGCTVNGVGCPADGDQDGICDGVDRCIGTPFGCRVAADGCMTDEDSDHVCDGLDMCPGTKFGCAVDAKGCHRDSDSDGVCDGMMDMCPDTPRGVLVDDHGCPMDSDGDTVFDGIDRCPDTPRGVEVNEYGCEKEVVLGNVQFDFDKAVVKPEFYGVLDKLGKAMKGNPKMGIRLHGHTDWVGTEDYNLKLSEARAKAVMEFLAKKGIAMDRMEGKGHGECCPVAPNTTDGGRYKNRRVEVERIR